MATGYLIIGPDHQLYNRLEDIISEITSVSKPGHKIKHAVIAPGEKQFTVLITFQETQE